MRLCLIHSKHSVNISDDDGDIDSIRSVLDLSGSKGNQDGPEGSFHY